MSPDSEQQGARQLLDQAGGRMATAQQRAEEAQHLWQGWEVDGFIGSEVLEALVAGARGTAALRRIGGCTPADR